MAWMIKNRKGEWWSARSFETKEEAQKYLDEYHRLLPTVNFSKHTVVETEAT